MVAPLLRKVFRTGKESTVCLTCTAAWSQSPLLTTTGMQPLAPRRLNHTLTEKSKKSWFLKNGSSIFDGLTNWPQSPHNPQFLRISTPKFFRKSPFDAMKSHFQSSSGSSNVMQVNGLQPIIGGGRTNGAVWSHRLFLAGSLKYIIICYGNK